MPSFLSGASAGSLDYTTKLQIDVDTRAEAAGAFEAVQGRPDSSIFWGRWDDTVEQFELVDGGFVVRGWWLFFFFTLTLTLTLTLINPLLPARSTTRT